MTKAIYLPPTPMKDNESKGDIMIKKNEYYIRIF